MEAERGIGGFHKPQDEVFIHERSGNHCEAGGKCHTHHLILWQRMR